MGRLTIFSLYWSQSEIILQFKNLKMLSNLRPKIPANCMTLSKVQDGAKLDLSRQLIVPSCTKIS